MISLSGWDFDVMEGEIQLPRFGTETFQSASTPYGGVQVLPSRAPQFKLQLTRYSHAADYQREMALGPSMVGSLISINLNGVIYDYLPHRCRFVVLEADIVKSQILPLACGSRRGIDYTFDPACMVVTAFTLQAVPM